MMKLFTTAIERKLHANGVAAQANEDFDPKPVVKVFNPTGGATWLLAWTDPTDPTRAFGLCDLGMGSPELGYVSMTELQTVRGRFGLGMERDRWFTADKPLSGYAAAARAADRIIA